MANTFNAELTTYASITQWFEHDDHPDVKESYRKDIKVAGDNSDIIDKLKRSFPEEFEDGDMIFVKRDRFVKKDSGTIHIDEWDYDLDVNPGDYIINTYATEADRTAQRNGTVSVISEAEYDKSEWRKEG